MCISLKKKKNNKKKRENQKTPKQKSLQERKLSTFVRVKTGVSVGRGLVVPVCVSLQKKIQNKNKKCVCFSRGLDEHREYNNSLILLAVCLKESVDSESRPVCVSRVQQKKKGSSVFFTVRSIEILISHQRFTKTEEMKSAQRTPTRTRSSSKPPSATGASPPSPPRAASRSSSAAAAPAATCPWPVPVLDPLLIPPGANKHFAMCVDAFGCAPLSMMPSPDGPLALAAVRVGDNKSSPSSSPPSPSSSSSREPAIVSLVPTDPDYSSSDAPGAFRLMVGAHSLLLTAAAPAAAAASTDDAIVPVVLQPFSATHGGSSTQWFLDIVVEHRRSKAADFSTAAAMLGVTQHVIAESPRFRLVSASNKGMRLAVDPDSGMLCLLLPRRGGKSSSSDGRAVVDTFMLIRSLSHTRSPTRARSAKGSRTATGVTSAPVEDQADAAQSSSSRALVIDGSDSGAVTEEAVQPSSVPEAEAAVVEEARPPTPPPPPRPNPLASRGTASAPPPVETKLPPPTERCCCCGCW